MDSRDNRQHRIRHQQVVPSYSGAVAPIYSGVDTARYDVAAGLTLAAGAYIRSLTMPRPRWRYAGMVG